MVETPPNSSHSFLKKLPNKIIELLFLPLLYSPSFFKLQNRPLVSLSGLAFATLRMTCSPPHQSPQLPLVPPSLSFLSLSLSLSAQPNNLTSHHHRYNKTQQPPHPTANSHLTQQPTATTLPIASMPKTQKLQTTTKNPSPINPTTNHHNTAP